MRLQCRLPSTNIQVTCPVICIMLSNTYQAPIKLFIVGEEEIDSSEGTTQGDSLAMGMYALAKGLLINSEMHSKVWFADDVTATERLVTLW